MSAPRQREITKLKKVLAARERQFQIAVKALKGIVGFKSAPLSIFSTEVEQVQQRAMRALWAMENVQRKKPLRVPATASHRPLLPQQWLTELQRQQMGSDDEQ